MQLVILQLESGMSGTSMRGRYYLPVCFPRSLSTTRMFFVCPHTSHTQRRHLSCRRLLQGVMLGLPALSRAARVSMALGSANRELRSATRELRSTTKAGAQIFSPMLRYCHPRAHICHPRAHICHSRAQMSWNCAMAAAIAASSPSMAPALACSSSWVACGQRSA